MSWIGYILREAFGMDASDVVPSYSLWWYEEKKHWRRLEGVRYRWKLKDLRPFIALRLRGGYVYLMLLTTKFKNRKYMGEKLGREALRADLSACDISTDRRCRWIRKECYIFGHGAGGSNYRIVFRLGRGYLRVCAGMCGTCEERVISDKVREIANKEIEEWIMQG